MLVHGDQVDLGAQPVQELYQPAGILGRIVHPPDQRVLEREAVAPRSRIAPAGLQQGRDRKTTIQRHQLIAHLIGRSMQRDREPHRQRPTELRHARNDARRGDGDPARGEPHPSGIRQDSDRADHVVEVEQRFSHAHKDHVRDLLARARQNLRPVENLVYDLARAQVAAQPQSPRRAKGAVQAAAHLRGDAERLTPGLGNQHRLDLRSVVRAQHQLAGAIGGLEARLSLQAAEAPRLIQPLAQGTSEIGHQAEIADSLPIHPAQHLIGPEAFEPLACEGLPELFGCVVQHGVRVSTHAPASLT